METFLKDARLNTSRHLETIYFLVFVAHAPNSFNVVRIGKESIDGGGMYGIGAKLYRHA